MLKIFWIMIVLAASISAQDIIEVSADCVYRRIHLEPVGQLAVNCDLSLGIGAVSAQSCVKAACAYTESQYNAINMRPGSECWLKSCMSPINKNELQYTTYFGGYDVWIRDIPVTCGKCLHGSCVTKCYDCDCEAGFSGDSCDIVTSSGLPSCEDHVCYLKNRETSCSGEGTSRFTCVCHQAEPGYPTNPDSCRYFKNSG